MSSVDFEVHIGLSRPVDAPDVAAIPMTWKREPVLNLISLKGSHEYEMHNVEGKLLALLTRHAQSIDEVKTLVEEAANSCREEPSSRIEIEQVLASSGPDLVISKRNEFALVPLANTFPAIKMIPETPPYEVHYCLSWARPEDAVSVNDVETICRDASIGIDEVVEFGGAKITTTKFYKTLERMMSELEGDASVFLAALARSGKKLRFRLIAERIITCGIPV